MTIHRLLQLPVELGNTPSYRPLSNNVLKIIRHTMENVVLLVIDKINMVSNITLSYIHLRLCEIFDTSDRDNGWFGRINILGDLLQLPLVNEASPFITLNFTQSKKYLNSLGTVNLWVTLSTYDELTQNMRQKNNPTYANILGRVRVNAVTLTDIDKIMLRKIAFKSKTKKDMNTQLNDLFITLSRNIIALLPIRKHCNTLNERILSLLPYDNISLKAIDSVDSKPSLKARALKKVLKLKNDSSRTAGLEQCITIKMNCKIMFFFFFFI
jgi:hypothetical protein